MTALVAAGIAEACGDAARGNLMECVGGFKADNVALQDASLPPIARHRGGDTPIRSLTNLERVEGTARPSATL
jgi:hypothetical protein